MDKVLSYIFKDVSQCTVCREKCDTHCTDDCVFTLNIMKVYHGNIND